MRGRAAAGAGVVGLALVLSLAVVPATAARAAPGGALSADPQAESVLELALGASRTVAYVGTQAVSVVAQRGNWATTLHVVHGAGDDLLIQSPDPPGPVSGSTLVQQGGQRLVVGLPDGSVRRGQAVGAGTEPEGVLQQILSKYRVQVEGSTRMLGRSAWLLRIDRSRDGLLVQRWTVDASTGLLLERDTYDSGGRLERSIAFTDVQVPYHPSRDELGVSSTVAAGGEPSQRWFAAGELGRLAARLGLPVKLAAGYRLHSATSFKVGGTPVVQLVYSDGLDELSLFDQPGRLAAGSLPPGTHKLKLRKIGGFAWDGFPRGVAWQSGPVALTVVGASPSDELTEIANGLPQAPLRQTLRQRAGHLVSWAREHLRFG